MFSVLILTLNEERNLPACLESVRGCNDVVVLDSGSTDRTVELAKLAGARVFMRHFDTFAQQRNHAHQTIEFRHPWVFHLDADERFTPELQAECSRYDGSEAWDGCWVAPKMFFQGRWIPRSTDFPAWQARFVQWRRFHFIDAGHGQREAPGQRMGRLESSYCHEIPSDDTDEWLAKHRRYAVAEARAYLATRGRLSWRDLLQRGPLDRRRALKHLSHALPARSWLRFLYQYVGRGGMWEGRAGWAYCRLLARYEGFISAELRQQRSTSAS